MNKTTLKQNKFASGQAKIILWVIIAVIVIAGIWYGTSRKPVITEKEPIKIGAILPLTGSLSVAGEALKNGMTLANEMLPEVLKNRIQLLIEDSQGDPKTAISAYNKLVQIDKVPVIIDSFSRELAAIIPLAQKDKVVIINQLALASFVETAGDYVFKLSEKNSDNASIITDVMKKNGHLEIAALVLKDEYCVDAFNFVKEELARQKIELILEENYEKNATDVRTQLSKIKNVNPQGVYVCGFYTDLGLVFKQAKETGLKTQFYSVTTFENPAIINITGVEAVEGVIYSIMPFNCLSEGVKEFCEKFKVKFGKNSDYRAAYGYDTVMVLAKALKNLIDTKKPINSENIKNELLNIHNYQGATGLIDFDQNGNAKRKVTLKTIKDGQFVPLENQGF